jgi:CRP-like cAMP-binding protein
MLQHQVLATVPLFAALDEEQLQFVAKHMQRRSYKERDVIVRRDAPGDALYILLSGKVKVSFIEDEDETIIAMLQAGEFFGELSLLDDAPRSADVVAIETTEAMVLSAEDFKTCLREVPGIAISLLKEMATRLRRSTGWIRSLSSQDVYGRIAQQLLMLSETHGAPAEVEGKRGQRIGLRLTQNDLAGIVGASRESVNKAMGYFKGKGYISVDSSYHITVFNREALERRCH